MSFDLNLSYIAVFIISLLISLTVHEFMHAYVAYRLGDPTAAEAGRVSFNPLSHIDPFMTVLLPVVLIIFGLPPILIAKPVPFNPELVRFGEFGSALMAVAGPLSNLALAAVAAITHTVLALTGVFSDILLLFVQLNIALFVFNMLPIPPLDGSRLLYAFAPEPVQKLMAQIESMGLVVVLLVLLLLSQFISPILSNINEAIFYFLV